MKGMLDRKNVKKDGVVVEVDGVKLGLFGIGQTPEQAGSPIYPGEEKALPAARRSIAYLRERGAEVIVAVTHLSRAEDEELIRQLTGAGSISSPAATTTPTWCCWTVRARPWLQGGFGCANRMAHRRSTRAAAGRA